MNVEERNQILFEELEQRLHKMEEKLIDIQKQLGFQKHLKSEK